MLRTLVIAWVCFASVAGAAELPAAMKPVIIPDDVQDGISQLRINRDQIDIEAAQAGISIRRLKKQIAGLQQEIGRLRKENADKQACAAGAKASTPRRP